MAGEVKDSLMLFLESCDPEKVSREWHVVRDEAGLLLERPTIAMPRRPTPRPKKREPTFAERRRERMLEEVRERSAREARS